MIYAILTIVMADRSVHKTHTHTHTHTHTQIYWGSKKNYSVQIYKNSSDICSCISGEVTLNVLADDVKQLYTDVYGS